MNVSFRVHVGNVNGEGELEATELLQRVHDTADRYFTGFTLYQARGVWRGQWEHSVIVEILGDKSLAPRVNEFARAIKARLDQEAVLVTTTNIHAELI